MLAWLLALVVMYWHFIAAYVVGGALYALLKWVIQLLRLRSKVIDINASALPDDSQNGRTAFNNKEWERNEATRKLFGSSSSYPPKASENKGTLFGWAVVWPVNLVYTLFADVAREAWNFLYRKFGAMLDKIATAILPK